MVHNPIHSVQQVGIGLARADIPAGHVALLYRHRQFQRMLNDGEAPGLTLPGSGYSIYIVDVAPQSFERDLALPEKSGLLNFPVRVRVEYHVSEPQRMVDQKVADTEALLVQAIKSALEPIARSAELLAYEALQEKLNAVFPRGQLDRLGLTVTTGLVRIRTEEAGFAAELQRQTLLTAKRELNLEFSLPDKSDRQRFPLRLELSYQPKSARLARPLVADDERVIRQRLEPLLQRESRQLLLVQHELLEDAARRILTPTLFDQLNLHLLGARILVRESDPTFQTQLRALDAIKQVRTLPVRFELPDRTDRFRFPILLVVDYAVTQPERYIERPDSIDLETPLRGRLDFELRRIAKSFTLSQAKALTAELEASLPLERLQVPGFQIIGRQLRLLAEDPAFQTSLEIYLQPRPKQLQVRVPDSTTKYFFPLIVDLRYAVDDEASFYTPAAIERDIEEQVRVLLLRESQRFRLDAHEELRLHIEQVITPAQFATRGATVTDIKVVVNREHPDFLRDLSRLRQVLLERPILFSFQLASRTGQYTTPVRVTGQYRIDQEEGFLDQQAAGIEQQLQDRLESELTVVSQNLRFERYDDLQVALDSAVVQFLSTVQIPGVTITGLKATVQKNDQQFQKQLRQVLENQASRDLPLRFDVPDESAEATFPLRVSVRYAVEDAELFPEERHAEMPNRVREFLEQRLRNECLNHSIMNYHQVPAALEGAIAMYELAQELPGVRFEPLRVAVLSEDPAFRDALRLLRGTQVFERDTFLPTQDATAVFRTTVQLQYRVINASELPDRSREQAAQMLWRKVEAALQMISRNFRLGEERDAQHRMNQEFTDRTIVDQGLEILSVSVTIGVDLAALEAEEERQKLLRERNLRLLDLERKQLEIEAEGKIALAQQATDLSLRERQMQAFTSSLFTLINQLGDRELAISLLRAAQSGGDLNDSIRLLTNRDELRHKRATESLKLLLDQAGLSPDAVSAAITQVTEQLVISGPRYAAITDGVGSATDPQQQGVDSQTGYGRASAPAGTEPLAPPPAPEPKPAVQQLDAATPEPLEQTSYSSLGDDDDDIMDVLRKPEQQANDPGSDAALSRDSGFTTPVFDALDQAAADDLDGLLVPLAPAEQEGLDQPSAADASLIEPLILPIAASVVETPVVESPAAKSDPPPAEETAGTTPA